MHPFIRKEIFSRSSHDNYFRWPHITAQPTRIPGSSWRFLAIEEIPISKAKQLSLMNIPKETAQDYGLKPNGEALIHRLRVA